MATLENLEVIRHRSTKLVDAANDFASATAGMLATKKALQAAGVQMTQEQQDAMLTGINACAARVTAAGDSLRDAWNAADVIVEDTGEIDPVLPTPPQNQAPLVEPQPE